MFAWWGRTVYRYRYIVIGVMVALCLGGGVFGLSLGSNVTQSGFYDDDSQSVRASVLGDEVYGRDRLSHIVAVYTAPEGKTVDDRHWFNRTRSELDDLKRDHSDEVLNWVGFFTNPEALHNMADADRKHAFTSIQLKGDDDDTILNYYKSIQPTLQELNDGDVKLAGLQPVADALTGTIATDQQRMEVLALPLVAVVLFFVFGGVIAASLPVIVGGLSIAGAMGILRLAAVFGPVHFFAQPVVSLIGLGIAIDYGLFMVSRFREEIAEGYDTEVAVRRTVITAGRTVTFSAVLIVASGASLLVLPQGFVKSLTYALIAAITLAALLSITFLPACLGVLGPNVDALGVRTLYRVPFLRDWPLSNRIIGWFAEKTQKTKTREEVEAGFWGRLVNFVMARPLVFAIPIVVAMILLIIPLGQLRLGGMSEKYLPPDNTVRVAQEQFDETFPGYRTEKLTLVIEADDDQDVTDQQVAEVRSKAMAISGFVEPDDGPDEMWTERPYLPGASKEKSVRVIENGLNRRDDAPEKLHELRDIAAPKGLSLYVGGTPALEQDSIHSLFANAPMMLLILLTTTTLLMFLAFGSLVLPLKAAVMSVLTLGSTMGILTWIFVDGHFSELLNFTPTPLTAPVIALVVAVGFGLATDYEVFLVSRMVEAREAGKSTTEAIRIGTATTGRLITAAALILAVVAGSFVFSDLVMMKYLAFGLMAALLLDATVIRMFLVPSVMKLLGDDCWWAPRWMKRLQTRIGLGEIRLPVERKRPVAAAPVGARAPAAAPPPGGPPRPPHDPTHPQAPPRRTGDAGTVPRSPNTFSASDTTRLRPPGSQPSGPNAAAAPGPRGQTPPAGGAPGAPAGPPARGREDSGPAHPANREIESWLGELRDRPGSAERADRPAGPQGHGGPAPAPSDDQTRGIPTAPNPANDRPPAESAETTAFPAQSPQDADSSPATEQLRSPGRRGNGSGSPRPRRGGVSAQDLLRREGRF